MKKFSVCAIMAMGIIAVSGAAFAGTTAHNARGLMGYEVADTVIPTDTVLPADTESTPAHLYTALADTVLPADSVITEANDTMPAFALAAPADTVVPTDTLTANPETQNP